MTFSACKLDPTRFPNIASNFEFSNDNLREASRLRGTKVECTCDSGYDANNNGEATCAWGGEWDPPVRCNEPSK